MSDVIDMAGFYIFSNTCLLNVMSSFDMTKDQAVNLIWPYWDTRISPEEKEFFVDILHSFGEEVKVFPFMSDEERRIIITERIEVVKENRQLLTIKRSVESSMCDEKIVTRAVDKAVQTITPLVQLMKRNGFELPLACRQRVVLLNIQEEIKLGSVQSFGMLAE